MKPKHPFAKQCTSFACVLASVFGLVAESSAVTYNVVTPTGVSFVDTTGNWASSDINNIINGSGVTVTGIASPIGTTIDSANIPSLGVTGDIDATGWRRNGSSIGSISFTFTFASSDVSGILLANYFENSGPSKRGINTFTFQYSSNSGQSYTSLGTLNASESSGGNFQLINLGTTLTGVTNIRFSSVTNFGADGTGNSNIVGMNEVRFVNAVPEPSAALLGGLGVLGLLRRRRI